MQTLFLSYLLCRLRLAWRLRSRFTRVPGTIFSSSNIGLAQRRRTPTNRRRRAVMANATNTQSEIDNRPNMGGQSGAAEQPTAQVAEKAKELVAAVSEKSKELASAVAHAAGTMAKDAASTVAQRAGDVASTVSHKAEDATCAVGSRIESFGHTVRERGPREGIMGTASSTV